jgi:thiol-disulfide isomerase/thioredoxin
VKKIIPTTIALSLTMGLTAVISTFAHARTTASDITTPAHPQQIAIAGAMKPLNKQLQGKPVVVDIYASWCPGCKNIAPTMTELRSQYQGKVNFVVFDVSDRKTTQASMTKARQLGLIEFFNAHKNQTSTVAIIDPKTGRTMKKFQNNPTIAEYQAIIDPAIAQVK